MKNDHKGFVLPLIIAIITLLAIGGGIYYSFNKSIPSNPTNNPTKVRQNIEWKTYSNSLLGFSLKYPNIWGEPKIDTWAKGSLVSFIKGAFYIDITAYVDPESSGGYVAADKLAEQTFQTLSTQKNITNLNQENIDLGGSVATKISYTSSGTSLPGTTADAPVVIQRVIRIFAPAKSGGVLEISYQFPLSDEDEQMKIFNEIISSFAFINTDQSINTNPSNTTFNIKPYTVEVAWQKQLTDVTVNCEGQLGCDYSTNYLAGQIINGELKGQSIYLRAQGEMGGDYYDHYVISNGKKISLEENKFTIKGISDLPEEISYPNSTYKMKKWYSPSILYKDAKPVKKLFSIAGIGDFYLTDFGCIMVELPNHTAIAYDFEIPFVNSENGEVNLTFNGGAKNNEQYEYTQIGGCGATCMYLADVKDTELKPADRLVVAGKASNGEDFYEYKNSSDPTLQALYNNKNTVAYISNEPDNYQQLATSKYTYQQFTSFHPLMYWKDPLGRWIEFKNKRFLVAAEKCKPVIYLYPAEKTSLNVKVTPNGGFIKTIPKYADDGWNVEAYPNGNIVDLKTNTQYDYIYWSGIGLNYPINETEGWVVKKENIPTFLDEKLKILGLNDKEIVDFKEYWVTKLSDMPYYQISFLPKNQLDQMAPLKISPVHPDTVIRVMLTAKGLAQTKDLKPQVLPTTPARNGFTVAEWGGVLLR